MEKGKSTIETKSSKMASAQRFGASANTALGIAPDQRQRMIEEAAYYRAEQRGFQGGDSVQDWLEAEAEIDAEIKGSAH